MEVNVLSIRGWEDAIISLYMSKNASPKDLDNKIKEALKAENYRDSMKKVLKIGQKHTTILRFIDVTIMTKGLHRAGQDDVDAHARRFDNRIVRMSSRLAAFDGIELSDWYKDKAMTTDRMYEFTNVSLMKEVTIDGHKWVKVPGGYVREEYKEDKDVLRGLYPLGLSSNFISKINICEFAHVYRMRNNESHANPEVKEWSEQVMDQITEICPLLTRDYILSIGIDDQIKDYVFNELCEKVRKS